MKKYPIALYFLPFIILSIIVALIYGCNVAGQKTGLPSEKKKSNKDKVSFETSTPEGEVDKSPELSFTTRVPIYPNSSKAALKEEIDSNQAVIYTTTDPIETVRDWYFEQLGGPTKVNLIDVVNHEGFRVITLSFSSPPKEVVEIREKFKGAKDLIITITTFDFYTRNQPRLYSPESESEEDKGKDESTEGKSDD